MVRKKIVAIAPISEKTLEEAFEQFVQSKRVMNISEETIKHYFYAFRYFKEFFGEGRRCEEVTKNTVFEYLAHLRENKPNVSPKTAQTYIKGKERRYTYAQAKNYLAFPPVYVVQ